MTAAIAAPKQATGLRLGRLLLCVALCGAAYGVVQLQSVRVVYAPWDKLAHGLAFFSVWWALRWSLGWRPLPLALLAAALGGAVEIHQMFLPGFTPSWADWAADLVGIAVALLIERLRRVAVPSRGCPPKPTPSQGPLQ